MKEVALIAVLLALLAILWGAWILVLQWAWNTIAPSVGVGSITWLQAFALSLILAAVSGGTRYVRSDR